MRDAKGIAIAGGELCGRDAGGNDMHRYAHAIVHQLVAHCSRGHHQRVHLIALGAGKTARQRPQRGFWNHRHVMEKVLLEKSVVGLHPWMSSKSAISMPK